MVAVFILDRGNRCRFINVVAEHLTGVPSSHAIGNDLGDLVWRGMPGAFDQSHLGQALGSDHPEEGEQAFVDGEGKTRLLAFRVVPIAVDPSEAKVVELVDLSGETGTGRALRESDRRLRLAAEATGIGIWDSNAVTGEEQWSEEFYAILGVSPDIPASSDLFLSVVHPADRAWLEALFRRAFRSSSDDPYSAEFRIVRANDGTERWLSVRGRVRFDAQGRALRGIGTLQDIHERRASEQAVRESEERLRIALVAGRMGLWRYDFATGLQEWDETQYEILGIDPGAPASRERFLSVVHPDDRRLVEFDSTDLPPAGSFLDSEFRIVLPDGEIRWLTAHAVVRHDETGAPMEMVGVNGDITERKEAALALRISEERHRLAVDANDVGTWDFDMVAGRHQWSAQFKRLWGLTEDSPSDPELLRPLVDPADWEAVQRSWGEAADPQNGSGKIAVEYQIRRADTGERRWCSFSGQVFFDAPRTRPVRAVGIMMDTTARKTAEERQLRLLKELHHRVNNNLAIIQAILTQATQRGTRPADMIERIQSRLMCLARIHQLLSRSESGETSIGNLLSSEIEFAHGSLERVTVNGEPIVLDSASALTLGLVFHELAANAAKHGAMSAREGKIEISWRLDDDQKPRLSIDWHEHSTRRTKAPRREGFGFRVIRSSIAGNLEGKADVAFTPDGVHWRLLFPMRLSERAAATVH